MIRVRLRRNDKIPKELHWTQLTRSVDTTQRGKKRFKEFQKKKYFFPFRITQRTTKDQEDHGPQYADDRWQKPTRDICHTPKYHSTLVSNNMPMKGGIERIQ